MPLLTYPHMTLKVSLDLGYCDGNHDDHADPMPEHHSIETLLVFTLIPPGDMQPDFGWPPVDDPDTVSTIQSTMIMVLARIAGPLTSIKGATPINAFEIVDDDGDRD